MSGTEDESEDVRWLSEDARGAWLAMAALVVKLPGALDTQLLAEAGVSFFEYMVLAGLSEQPDLGMQMSDLAAFTSASLSRLSHTASRLEEHGLMTRHQVPGHGRRTRAVLTDAGLEKVRSAAPGHVMHVRHLLIDGLPRRDVATLTRLGERVLAAIDAQ